MGGFHRLLPVLDQNRQRAHSHRFGDDDRSPLEVCERTGRQGQDSSPRRALRDSSVGGWVGAWCQTSSVQCTLGEVAWGSLDTCQPEKEQDEMEKVRVEALFRGKGKGQESGEGEGPRKRSLLYGSDVGRGFKSWILSRRVNFNKPGFFSMSQDMACS